MTRAAEQQRGKKLTLAKGLRFSCKTCGDCCRSTPVVLTPEEVSRYDARDWSGVLAHPVVTVHDAGYLRRKPEDGTCLFLGADSRCLIHEKLGEQEKPLTCRLFPFRLVPSLAGGPAIVAAQFACSSVAAGEGEPVASRRRALDELAQEVMRLRPEEPPPAAIPFDRRGGLASDQVEALLDAMVKELEDDRPFPDRFLAVVKLTSLVAGSNLERLRSPAKDARPLIPTFAEGIHEQAKRGLLRPRLYRPALPERLLFRQVLGLGLRRDPARLLAAGPLRRGVRRFGNLLAGMAFMAGSGSFIPVGRERRVSIGETRRRAPPADPYAPEADGALTRYFLAQLSGRVILAPSFAVKELLPALGLLFRQFPIVLLLARAACLARGGDALTRDDYASALRTADWSFGAVGWTSGPIGRVRARLLSDVEACFSHLPWCAGQPGAAAAALPG